MDEQIMLVEAGHLGPNRWLFFDTAEMARVLRRWNRIGASPNPTGRVWRRDGEGGWVPMWPDAGSKKTTAGRT